MKKIVFLILVVCAALQGNSQTREDIFGKAPITWLGLDFTHLKAIGSTAQFKDAGSITNPDMRSKYFTAWNNLFITEPKKYNVANAVHRNNVNYAIEVTQNANDKSTAEYFTEKTEDYRLLTEDVVRQLVAGYDFKGKTGIGMLVFVEGMSMDKKAASMWVAFVDMGSKKMLFGNRMSGNASGTGFSDYWATSFYNVLQDVKNDFKQWDK